MSLTAYVFPSVLAAVGGWIAWSVTDSLVAMGLTHAIAAVWIGAWAGYSIVRGKPETYRRRRPAWQLAVRALGTALAIVALFAVIADLGGVDGENAEALRLTGVAVAVLASLLNKDINHHRTA